MPEWFQLVMVVEGLTKMLHITSKSLFTAQNRTISSPLFVNAVTPSIAI
jgi:hypothetical protein